MVTPSYDFVHLDSKARGTAHGLGKGKENSRYFCYNVDSDPDVLLDYSKNEFAFSKVLF